MDQDGRDQTLNLSYRTLGSSPGVLSFKLIGKEFANAAWLLKTRTEAAQEQALDGNRAMLPESWWGDRYWKTPRNAPGGPHRSRTRRPEPKSRLYSG